MLDLEELERLADAATPGPWYRKDAESQGTYGHEWIDGVEGAPFYSEGYSDIADCSGIAKWKDKLPQNVETDQIKANAAYIAAANPKTIKALIADNRAQAELIEALEAALLKAVRPATRELLQQTGGADE